MYNAFRKEDVRLCSSVLQGRRLPHLPFRWSKETNLEKNLNNNGAFKMQNWPMLVIWQKLNISHFCYSR